MNCNEMQGCECVLILHKFVQKIEKWYGIYIGILFFNLLSFYQLFMQLAVSIMLYFN